MQTTYQCIKEGKPNSKFWGAKPLLSHTTFHVTFSHHGYMCVAYDKPPLPKNKNNKGENAQKLFFGGEERGEEKTSWCPPLIAHWTPLSSW